MAVKHETELYGPVKSFWVNRGYDVKAEIRGCDLVAMKPNEPRPVIVEMKKTFTLPLLLQGIDRQRTGAEVWLAVERNRVKKGAHNQRYTEIASLCARLSLGLMTVTFYKTKAPVIEVWSDPVSVSQRAAAQAVPMSGIAESAAAGAAPEGSAGTAAEGSAGTATAAAIPTLPLGGRRRGTAKLLKEFAARSGDYNIGGSVGRKLITAYRERSLKCALALLCNGRLLAPREVAALAECQDAGSLLRANYYGWFRRAERGIYELTPSGADALLLYREVTDLWASRLPWAAEWEANLQTITGRR